MSKPNTCNRCGDCCRQFFINLNETEYKSGKFQTFFEDINSIKDFTEASFCGANFVTKKKDGSCVYLKDNSCTIHNGRPQSCREFFCI